MSKFKRTVLLDIKKGEELIESRGNVKDHVYYLDVAYSMYVPRLHDMAYSWSELPYERWVQKLQNINEVLRTHASLVPMDSKGNPIPYEAQIKGGSTVNNHNNNQASAVNEIDVNVTISLEKMFEQVKDELDGELSDAAYEELISKIVELEEIHNSERTRGKKWSKTKGVFDWITTQGVDVAVKLLPLILKMMEQ